MAKDAAIYETVTDMGGDFENCALFEQVLHFGKSNVTAKYISIKCKTLNNIGV